MKKKLTWVLVLAVAAIIAFAGVAMALTDPVVYGIERYTGNVYAIEPTTGAAELVWTVVGAQMSRISPNGLAWDPTNGRLYYTTYPALTAGQTDLYFWDGAATEIVAGTLAKDIAAATWANGAYYYIAGGGNDGRTDDFYRVTFNANGTIATETKLADLTATDTYGVRGWFFDGDIAYNKDDNCIYGWGSYANFTYEFFKINLADNSFTRIRDVGYLANWSLQLAFGQNGVLYGHRAYDSGEFYSVDLGTGATTLTAASSSNPLGGYLLFTDLASAPSGGQTAEISGLKWHDYDKDGDWLNDPTEPFLQGWEIKLYKDEGSGWVQVNVAYTSQDGGYVFADLQPGSYKVEETQQTGWTQTYPATSSYLVTIAVDGTVTTNPTVTPGALDFGNVYRTGCPKGYTPGFWSNKNGKAILDANPGWMTYLSGYRLVDGAGNAFDPTGYSQFRTWLLGAKATNMSYMMSVQMAATLLNIAYHSTDYTGLTLTSYYGGQVSVGAFIAEADAFLAANPNTPTKHPARAQAEFYKNIFDGLNNNTVFGPCGDLKSMSVSQPASVKGKKPYKP